jgi:hypothetical protein
MFRVLAGAVLVIAGIAAFIEAHAHHPVAAYTPPRNPIYRQQLEQAEAGLGSPAPASGLDPTVYDLLRIGAWALVIIGGLLVATGLIRYWADTRRERGAPGA